MQKKTVGILGGMGPLATADLFHKIVLHTDATTDQEHLHILVDNNTAIPDRTAALLGDGEDPYPYLLESIRTLERAGAECLAIPCNAAHCYLPRLQETTPLPILDMVELTCRALEDAGVTRAGLLAVTGTIHTKVYHKYCEKHGITLLIPEGGDQDAVMDLIYRGVKAGASHFDAGPILAVVDHLRERGAQTMILGCTELPLALEQYHISFPAVDPTLELAKGVIRFAGGRVR